MTVTMKIEVEDGEELNITSLIQMPRDMLPALYFNLLAGTERRHLWITYMMIKFTDESYIKGKLSEKLGATLGNLMGQENDDPEADALDELGISAEDLSGNPSEAFHKILGKDNGFDNHQILMKDIESFIEYLEEYMGRCELELVPEKHRQEIIKWWDAAHGNQTAADTAGAMH